MAELVLDDGETGELEVVEALQQEREAPVEKVVELPAKYRNKTPEELVKMHQEAEKLIDRQSAEVGEVRKLADELIKSQLHKEPKAEKPEIDFFENPKEAVRQAIETHPRVIAAEQQTMQLQMERARQVFNSKHPDATQITQDADFMDWVKASPIRVQLYQAADAYNVDAADELLSTYKVLRQTRQQSTEQADKSARSNALRAASVDSGGSGESSQKVYRRADLIRLNVENPSKFEAMRDEIDRAYQEGRVR